MSKKHHADLIPIIDLFAGPGGLGEGFSSFTDSAREHQFHIGLSVEKDAEAHKTLLLRAFYRQFPKTSVPVEYYYHLQGKLTREKLLEDPRFRSEVLAADREAWNAELGIEETDKTLHQRVGEALGESKSRGWVLIGGPPCQAYSLVGRSRRSRAREKDIKLYEQDVLHYLYRQYLRILARHLPPVFVMENVKGMLSAKIAGKLIFDRIREGLENPEALPRGTRGLESHTYVLFSFVQEPRGDVLIEPKLDPSDFVIKSEDYQIPQKRHRVIILGIRRDLVEKFSIRPKILARQMNWVPLRQVIGDLPKLRSGLSARFIKSCKGGKVPSWDDCIREVLRAEVLKDRLVDKELRFILEKKAAQIDGSKLGRGGEFISLKTATSPEFNPERWYTSEKLSGVCNHEARSHIGKDLQRYFFAACFARSGKSPTLDDLPDVLLPAHKNAQSDEEDKIFADRFRVQLPGLPATTVTSHISKDGHYFIHYDPLQCRSLSVREAARIQTFPDDYLFCGNRTSQYHQVGNAVPPLLAKQLAAIVLDVLEQAHLR